MPQISIPAVAFYPDGDKQKRVQTSSLENALKIPPEFYIDDEHHDYIYCPDCGVMCSRAPRKQAKRKDLVDAYYFHIKGYEDVPCPHRQGGGGGKGDGPGKERKAINLVTFAGWKGFQDEDEEDDEFPDENKKPKRKVERGAGGIHQGIELFFDKNGSLLNAGQFKTVRRLVYLAQKSLDINIQFGDQDAVRLGDLIVSIEKLQSNSAKYIGKSLLLFGKPTSIKSGNARHFFNFQSPGHEVSMHCDPRIVKDREWKSYERDHYYIFYGLIEGTVAHTTIKILEPGQIDRLPTTARDLFNSLR